MGCDFNFLFLLPFLFWALLLVEIQILRRLYIRNSDFEKALYLSITREWVRKIGIQILQDTKVNVTVADWEELALYIALTHDQSTINKIGLEDLVYKRRYRTGPRPGITMPRVFSGPPQSGIEDKWLQPLRTPSTDQEEKALVAEAVIKNHCYAFNNKWMRQTDGGAIGNSLTGR